MATLTALKPNAFNSQTGSVWNPTTVSRISEGIANADGISITSAQNSTGNIFYDIDNVPADFYQMLTLYFNFVLKLTGWVDDTERLYIQIFKSDLITSLTSEELVRSSPFIGTDWYTTGKVQFTSVSSTASKTDWDGAAVRLRTDHNASMAADDSYWDIDCFELTGTYTVPAVVDSFVGPNNYSISGGYDSDVSQSFTGIYGPITKMSFYLSKHGSPTGTLTAKYYSHTGTWGSSGLPNTLLLASTTTLNQADISSTPTWYDFNFDGSVYLVTGTHYCAMLSFSTSGSFDNGIWVGSNTSAANPNPIHPGNTAEKYGGSWHTFPQADILFYVYGATASNIKTVVGVAQPNIKKIVSITNANVKKVEGVLNV